MFSARKALRSQLLRGLYEYHFETIGKEKVVKLDDIKDQPETAIAYQYLADKGLISMKHLGGKVYHLKITVNGIDQVESQI